MYLYLNTFNVFGPMFAGQKIQFLGFLNVIKNTKFHKNLLYLYTNVITNLNYYRNIYKIHSFLSSYIILDYTEI